MHTFGLHAGKTGLSVRAEINMMRDGRNIANSGCRLSRGKTWRQGWPTCPRCALWQEWSLAWLKWVVDVAGPSADLAALVTLGLPGVPGRSGCGVEVAGRRRVQKTRNSRSGPASRVPPTARAARSGQSATGRRCERGVP